MRIHAACAVVLVALLLTGCGVDNAVHVDGIRAVLDSKPTWVERTALGRKLWELEKAFYAERGHTPVWVNGDQSTAYMDDLLEELRMADRHGLAAPRYGVDEFDQIRRESQTRFRGTRFAVERVPELDLKLTYSYLTYAADLLGWSTSPRHITTNWSAASNEADLAARLHDALGADRVRESLQELAPAHGQYLGLQAALASELARPTGRADVIRMNLERWRWAPRDLGDRHILINVPAYMLHVMDGNTRVLAMRVVVGKPSTPTPLFTDEMTYVVFSPYWNIPEGILKDETLPRLARDPGYLGRNNLEVVRGSHVVDPASIDWSNPAGNVRIRQRPGPRNALGLIKFIFPNHFDVYLHDTPEDRLFRRKQRTFSHGCIRVEDPVALARYVLGDQARWTTVRISSAMRAGREQTAKLRDPLPVHIGYWTAWVNPDGSVTFFDDPYGIDSGHGELLAKRDRSEAARAG